MSIFVTGDIHGEIYPRFSNASFPMQKELTKDDIVIVAGDFGIPWTKDGAPDAYALKELEKRPFTTCFVDGNHENYDLLEQYPEQIWHGGRIHRINDSVIHLMRGQVFDIDGTTIFTFGGAASHDIEDGILNAFDPDVKAKARALRKAGKYRYRINHLSWWEREKPNQSEYDEGLANLAKHDFKVDYIITHCPPTTVLRQMGFADPDDMTRYFQDIMNRTRFRVWYFGHLHSDCILSWERAIALYHRIMQIA